jgi:FkbM family methyltransferase
MKNFFSSINSFFIYLVIKFFFFLEDNIKKIRKVKFDKFSKNKQYQFYSHNKFHFVLFAKDQYISRSTYINGPYDFFLLRKSINCLPKSFVRHTLIDVGANIGTVCVPAMLKKIFKECIAIEPNDNIFRILKSNILINNCENKIRCFNYCISSKNNENLSFTINMKNFGDTRFIKNSSVNDKLKFLKNRVKKLDYFFNLVDPKKTLIKIDAQGFESNVIMGSKSFLNCGSPLLLEFDPSSFLLKDFEKIFDLLKNNYQYYFDLDEKISKKNNILELKNLFFILRQTKKYKNILIRT